MTIYFIQTTILFTLCWLFEKTIFSRDRSFVFRRLFVLAAMIIVPILPFLTIPQAQDLVSFELPELILGGKYINGEKIGRDTIFIMEHFLRDIIFGIYWVGVLIGMISFLREMGMLIFKISKSPKIKRREFTEIEDMDTLEPYSFFKYINLGRFSEASGLEKQIILTHELVHVRQLHSVDNLIATLIVIFFWFIPPAHFLKYRLKLIHEYLADNEASRKSGIKNYCLLLVRASNQHSRLQLFNTFYFEPLKNRIMMMANKNQSKALKKMLLLPFFFLCLTTVFLAQKSGAVAELSPPPPPPLPPPPPPVPVPDILSEGKIANPGLIDKMPRFYSERCEKIKDDEERNSCAQTELIQSVNENLKYPVKAQKEKVEGKVIIQFVVETDGSLSDIEIVSQTDTELGMAALDAVKLLAGKEKFIPGSDKGVLTRVRLSLPIQFKL